jgi:hypothetical protein
MTNSATPQDEIDALLGELDAEFGKKAKTKGKPDPEAIRKERNKKFHEQNPQISAALGKAPELDLSGNWQIEARITYVTRQHCRCCGETVAFIGGEFIRFRSKRLHAWQDRRSEHCPNLFLYDRGGNPIPDLIEELDQDVSRCPGCIAVERQAVEIWEQATQPLSAVQPKLFAAEELDIPSEAEIDAILKEDNK